MTKEIAKLRVMFWVGFTFGMFFTIAFIAGVGFIGSVVAAW